MVGKVFRCKKFLKNSKFPDFKPFLFDLGDPKSCYCIAYQVIYSSAGSNLNFNFHKFECGLNSNMRVKFKGGLNCQLPTAIRVKSKCGLTSRAGKMHVITVYGSHSKFKLQSSLTQHVFCGSQKIVLGEIRAMQVYTMTRKNSKNCKKYLHSTISYKYKIVLWKFFYAGSQIRAVQICAM